jgi:hypothetical protein
MERMRIMGDDMHPGWITADQLQQGYGQATGDPGETSADYGFERLAASLDGVADAIRQLAKATQDGHSPG